MTRRPRAILTAVALPLLAACARAQDPVPPVPPAQPATSTVAGRDTLEEAAIIPAGFGSLRQDDVAIRIELGQLQVKAIPLEESVIRTLSPDSYRALHDLVESRRERMDEIARRRGLRSYRAWYVSFFALQPDVPYSPQEVVIVNNGREFRPLDVLPLNANFGAPRLRQRETQAALYVFDGNLDPQQPLTLQVESTRSDAWQTILQRVERERAMVRSRASKQQSPQRPGP